MKEWPESGSPEKEPLSLEVHALADRINSALEDEWHGLADTTNPEVRTFGGFGSPEEVTAYLTSQGIDLSGLRIEMGAHNRLVSVYMAGRAEPIYRRYFSDHSDTEREEPLWSDVEE